VEGKLTLGVAYAPSLDELFVAQAGRGATVNNRPIQVSTVSELSQALLATGFPYDRREFARALRSFEVVSLKSQAVRRAGSAVLDLCYVACGRLDGYWEHQVMPWDMAAGALVVLEAGGAVSATDGSALASAADRCWLRTGCCIRRCRPRWPEFSNWNRLAGVSVTDRWRVAVMACVLLFG
jgi:myo-inositol-1(or 4)-monophosphatase